MDTTTTDRPSEAASELVHFHLLGRTLADHSAEQPGMIPAVLAPYRDLATLRHDYPLVLTDDVPFVDCLTDLVNRALRRLAPPGGAGERLRRLVLAVEAGVRRRVVGGEHGTLGELWDADVRERSTGRRDTGGLEAELADVRNALPVDGRLLACDADTPAAVVAHLWRLRRRAAGRDVRARIDELIVGLEDVLRVEVTHTDEGRSPEHLRASVGGVHRDAFDFDGWSAVVRTGPSAATMPATRRARIESALEVLHTQQFFPGPAGPDGGDAFTFTSCAAAAAAYVERVPVMVRLVRAMAIAELELQNAYRPAVHDRVFAAFDERSLTPEDVAIFPSYLVCVTDGDLTSTEQAQLLGILGSDAPINVVVGVGDVLGPPDGLPLTNGAAASGIGHRLGTMAIGLGTAFVLQTVGSNLLHVRDRIDAGVTSGRPALFSVFTGSTEHVPHVAPYLVAAMAMQSRAFPTFTFDPDAGPEWFDRFDIGSNPEPEATWTAARVDFEDTDMQRRHHDVELTPVDLAALDRRYGGHFTIAPPDSWSDDMRPATEMVPQAGTAVNGYVPYVLLATEEGVLQRAVVDRQLLREVRQYAATWRSLQELAGIDNSYARALLAGERARWEAEHTVEPAEPGDRSASAPATPAAQPAPDRAGGGDPALDAAVADIADAGAARADGEAYIETVRCTTCDECTKLNPKMFAYDGNKQAYIVDLTAGTFRQLVEAAEACQVAIIHPGRPWDPSEPNLDELVARAAAFA